MTPVENLVNWVAVQHHGQLIKRTLEPYFNHVLTVANLAKPVVTLGFEIGLCHDLLEDTDTTAEELPVRLITFGYTETEANTIAIAVVELTDVFTREAYPDLKKKERKKMEQGRLLLISPAAQTVKCCDLIYNIKWMLRYERKHAKKYLQKKQILVTGLIGADPGLRQQTLDLIQIGLSDVRS